MLRVDLILLLGLIGLYNIPRAIAFTTVPFPSPSQASSLTILFAANKKKTKIQKNSNHSRGAGFGNSSAPKASSSPKTINLQQFIQPTETVEGVTSDTTAKIRKSKREKWAEQEQDDEPVSRTPNIARQARRQKWIDRAEASEEATAITQAKALFTQAYHQQMELSACPKPNQLVQISQDPLIFIVDDFIDPAACERVQSNGAGCFGLLYPERIADLLFQGQESELDGLLFNAANSQQHAHKPVYPDGLHVDTNGQCLFRHVTCLLYLNTIPPECGGATVFPIARALPNDPALVAAQQLLHQKISHTNSRAVQLAGLTAQAKLLESRTGANFDANPQLETAIKIQPNAGRLLVFFSRNPNGQEDPRSWHSGERIYPDAQGRVTEKRILTLFKEVDYTHNPGPAKPSLSQTTFEDYLAPLIQQQQAWLQWKAQDQSPVA